MNTIRTKSEIQKQIQNWRQDGLRIGYVPTMGALHAGHLSLVKKAMDHTDKVVVSIFVNPTQFAPHEDLDTYPRDEAEDLKKLGGIGADLVYIPSVADMYPDGLTSDIKPGAAAEGLETDFRPHFFGGVVNIVVRLFDHVPADIAVFGEKDFQQLQVIKEMVAAQGLGIHIMGSPIIRDEHGLALSSRNEYLSGDELVVARSLNTVLYETARRLESEPDAAEAILKEAEKELYERGFDNVDYVSCRWDKVLAAVWIGKTRLIDNVPV